MRWIEKDKVIEALNHADVIINLAGKSVDCRYTKKHKEAISRSRIDTTKDIGIAILACKEPPKLWINSSTSTIYRHAEDRPMTEKDCEIVTGFSVAVGGWGESLL